MKNKKTNIFILVVAIVLVLYLTMKDDFGGIIKQLTKVNPLIFLIAIIIFFLSLLFKAISLNLFLTDYKKDYTLSKTFQLTLIGQLLNGITPFQSGGQPFQVYLLKNDGVRITDSTNAMIKDFISFQISLIMMGVFAILLNIKLQLLSSNNYLNSLIILGFFINVLVLLFLIFISASKESGKKIIGKIINFIYKFKIVKKLGSSKEKAMEGLNHFYEVNEEARKNKPKLFLAVLVNLIHLVLLYMIPAIIFMSLGCNSVTILTSIVSTSFVMLIGNFIPIPGATGGIEYSFLQFFGVFVTGPLLSSAMLLWRSVTYLFGMLIGFITLIFKKEVLK